VRLTFGFLLLLELPKVEELLRVTDALLLIRPAVGMAEDELFLL
jgi:hypothetical protein